MALDPTTILTAVAAMAGSYLLGGIPWSLLVGRWVKGIDLRMIGSGNLGATNVARNLGGGWAIAVFALDFTKAALAAAASGMVAPPEMTAAFQVLGGVSAILGHVYSPYIRFRGGKGIAATAGAAAIIFPWVLLGGAIAFFAVGVSTRRVSLGSLTIAAVAVPLTVWLHPEPWRIAFAIGVAILIVWAHRSNIGRLIRREEPKVSWGIFKDRVKTDADAGEAGAPAADETGTSASAGQDGGPER